MSLQTRDLAQVCFYACKTWLRTRDSGLARRDQTIVHYVGGEGVAPHVDGKDVTILLYLNDVPHGRHPSA
eukprot:scaffold922_cov327-Pinguiococcus_pyrenoidosus.AAC.39